MPHLATPASLASPTTLVSPPHRFCNWLEESKPSYYYRGRLLTYQRHELVITSTRDNIQKVVVEFNAHVNTVGEIRRAARFLVSTMTRDSGLQLALFQAYSKNNGGLVVFANVFDTVIALQQPGDKNNELIELDKAKAVEHGYNSKPADRSRNAKKNKVSFKVRNTQQALYQSINEGKDDLIEPQAKPTEINVAINAVRKENLIPKTEDLELPVTLHQAHSRDKGRVTDNHDNTFQLSQQSSDDKGESIEPRNKTKNAPGIGVPIAATSEEFVIWKSTRATRKGTFNGSEVMLPALVRSQGVSTTDIESQPIDTEPRKRCEIPLDYDSPEFADKILMSYLTNTNVYERARLQLAYFRYERNASINQMSYVNNKVYLACNGLPQDDSELERIYYKFCSEKGINKEDVDKDMEATKKEMDNKLMALKSVARRNFNELYTPNRHVASSGGSAGGCDPELCSIM